MEKFQNLSNISLNESIYHEDFSIHWIVHSISNYEAFVTIPLGIIGNLISIFIFTRPSLNKKTNTGLLFTILCLLNLIIILYEGLLKWKTFLYLTSKFKEIFKRIIEQSLSWIQVLISFDRFITVFLPIKGVRLMNKKSVLFSIIICLIVLIIGVKLVYYWYTSTNRKQFSLNGIINSIIDLHMKIIIPYLIIVVLDLMVIVRLKRSKTEFRARQPLRRSKCFRFTINTIVIDLLFLICNLLFIFQFYKSMKIKIEEGINHTDLNVSLASSFLRILSIIYSHLFFILFLIFNRIFRHEFISIFKRNSCFNNINSSSS